MDNVSHDTSHHVHSASPEGSVVGANSGIQTEQKKNRQRRLRKVIISLLCAVLFFALTTAYSQYQVYVLEKLSAVNDVEHPSVPTTPDQIVEAVSKHIILPDTVPQIAAVQDAKKLSTSQTFFQNAENGDVVLVYTTAIYLYRPSQDILVAVGDISGTGTNTPQ